MDSFGQRDNNGRADAAAAALEAYTTTNTAQYREESIETRVGDLICDLLHLVRRDAQTVGIDADEPTDLLDRARANFEEEESEEADEEGDDADYSVCSGEGCDTSVHRDDDYFATPCGTFCAECMAEHVKGCGVCASEFCDEFPEAYAEHAFPAAQPPYRVRWVERTEFIALVMDAASPEAAIQEAIDAGPQSAIESEVSHVIEKGLLS